MKFELPPVVDSATVGALGAPRATGSSVVIVTYNNEGCMEECLHSVLASIGSDDEVVLVDNASSDATLKIVRRFVAHTNRLSVIENRSNLGFSAACNVGMKVSGGRNLVLLNPDTVVWPRWIEKLERSLSVGVGAVGPVSDVVAGDQFVGRYLEPGLPLHEIQDRLTERFPREHIATKLLIGFCIMLPREVLNQIGLLDEALFLGSDDLELSWRIRTHGMKLRVVKDVFVRHRCHVSFQSLDVSSAREMARQSDEVLRAKLAAYYGEVPSDQELWGVTFGK